jgi:uncharacterized protein YuzE
MKERYLEVTFRNGKPLAAYIYLSHNDGEHAEHTKKVKDGIIVDFNSENKIIGIEITAPLKVSKDEINVVLNTYQVSPLTEQEWEPLIEA